MNYKIITGVFFPLYLFVLILLHKIVKQTFSKGYPKNATPLSKIKNTIFYYIFAQKVVKRVVKNKKTL